MALRDRRRFMGTMVAAAATRLAVPQRAMAANKTLTILMFGGELPEVQRDFAKDYRVNVLHGGRTGNGVVGLEQLELADLFLGSVDKRILPNEEQLNHFKKYHAAGKPVVGYRAATHLFQNWLIMDREVFGMKYGGHHHKDGDPRMIIEIGKGVQNHPILRGLTPPQPISGSYVYTDMAPDVTILLRSGFPGDTMPHTWVRENPRTKGRVFYTRYDAKQIATDPAARRLFLRGMAWTFNRDLGPYGKKPAQ